MESSKVAKKFQKMMDAMPPTDPSEELHLLLSIDQTKELTELKADTVEKALGKRVTKEKKCDCC